MKGFGIDAGVELTTEGTDWLLTVYVFGSSRHRNGHIATRRVFNDCYGFSATVGELEVLGKALRTAIGRCGRLSMLWMRWSNVMFSKCYPVTISAPIPRLVNLSYVS
jgi:hypothetical protein